MGKSSSILTSIKKMLGVDPQVDAFDDELIILINSVFMNLTQLGIGPESGFSIEEGYEKWTDFLSSGDKFEAVKGYVYIKVKLIFDPPNNSFLIEAFNKQAEEFEWRLNIQAEGGLLYE